MIQILWSKYLPTHSWKTTDTPSAARAKARGKTTVHTGLSQVLRLRQMPAQQGADLTSSCARPAGPWLSVLHRARGHLPGPRCLPGGGDTSSSEPGLLTGDPQRHTAALPAFLLSDRRTGRSGLHLTPADQQARPLRWPHPSRGHPKGSTRTHFEVGGLQCRAGEEPGEDHVYGDREAPTHVPIGDLNVLNLCGIAGVPFCTAWSREKASRGQNTANVQTG